MTRGGPPAWRLGRGLVTPRHKNQLVMECYKGPRIWTPVANSCEHGNEPSGSVKGGEFLDFLNDC
jgi:hypothetical protein